MTISRRQTRWLQARHTAITLAEHQALNLERPLTDQPIGATTDRTRETQAVASAIHTDNGTIAQHTRPIRTKDTDAA